MSYLQQVHSISVFFSHWVFLMKGGFGLEVSLNLPSWIFSEKCPHIPRKHSSFISPTFGRIRMACRLMQDRPWSNWAAEQNYVWWGPAEQQERLVAMQRHFFLTDPCKSDTVKSNFDFINKSLGVGQAVAWDSTNFQSVYIFLLVSAVPPLIWFSFIRNFTGLCKGSFSKHHWPILKFSFVALHLPIIGFFL